MLDKVTEENHPYADIRDFLKNCIDQIKKRHPYASSIQLAKKLDISSSTFGRLENKEIRKPSFNIVIKIVRAVCDDGDVKKFIGFYYPEMAESFVQTYQNNANLPFVATEIEEYFEEPSTFELMILATSKSGISREKIQSTYGSKGLLILDNLLKKNILKEGNNIISIATDYFNANQTTWHKLLKNLLSMNYNVEKFGTQTNWLSVQFESVNIDRTRPLINNILNNAFREIKSVMTDPKNHGYEVLWTGLVMDSIGSHNLSTESLTREGV